MVLFVILSVHDCFYCKGEGVDWMVCKLLHELCASMDVKC